MAEEQSRAGVVGSLIAGVGALILLVILLFVVISAITDADLLRETATTSTGHDTSAFVNSTGYTLDGFDGINRTFAVTLVQNETDGSTVSTGNYTFSSATGVLTNATAINWGAVNITYTYIGPTNFERTSDNLNANFTAGIDNVSSKVPTILLLGAIVLLFGVIVLLVMRSRKMGVGVGGSGTEGSL